LVQILWTIKVSVFSQDQKVCLKESTKTTWKSI